MTEKPLPQAPTRPEETSPEPHFFRRLHTRMHANPVTGLATKVVVTVVGIAVILAGLVMMVAPGPGIVAIILGLAILSTEWSWAERALDRAKEAAHNAAEKARNMDPKVRQRRLVASGFGVVLVFAAVTTYVVLYGWPKLAIAGWNWVQGLSGVVPELPGM
ncbi:PGPGW domain-containing protein [Nocardioides houyundeii]|uniref:PGPGW domain-containing protein n=1 Tax=Nocardioides houyundeii TaxID=2045452 RepID=UPI000C7710ED|nr:PGPGW domain-containing protein [Nocardioides houyundeii]